LPDHTITISRSNLRRGVATTLALAAAALLTLSLATTAAGSGAHRVNLDSTMFAAQVGSTTNGGSVYAGALPDRTLGQGAIVFTATGKSTVRVTFQEFFARGSVKGVGQATLTPMSGGQSKLTGSFTIKRGTGSYRNATGKLTANGTMNKSGMIQATLKGSFTH
jgi:hypothetical protein